MFGVGAPEILLILLALIWMPGASAPALPEKGNAFIKPLKQEGMPGGHGDNHAGGRPRHIHDSGIPQEP
jgi:hypothetical protein